MARNFSSLYLLLLAGSLLMGGCSDDKSEKPASSATETPGAATAAGTAAASVSDACSLITEEDAAKALGGGTVTRGMSTASMCQYTKDVESVSLTLHSGAAGEFDNYVKRGEEDLKIKAKPVDGVGDKAMHTGGGLVVASGSDMIEIIVGRRLPEAQLIAVEKELAQVVLGRLK